MRPARAVYGMYQPSIKVIWQEITGAFEDFKKEIEDIVAFDVQNKR